MIIKLKEIVNIGVGKTIEVWIPDNSTDIDIRNNKVSYKLENGVEDFQFIEVGLWEIEGTVLTMKEEDVIDKYGEFYNKKEKMFNSFEEQKIEDKWYGRL